MDAKRTVERAARESYGRLIAYLSVRFGDVMRAEDALSDAFVAALESWPVTGLPQNPDAWLLTAARRRLIDGTRHQRVRHDVHRALFDELESTVPPASHDMPFPDERLRLLFTCAHPAIAPEMRTPLMLQLILGLNATAIGSAFLIAPSTMGQRLVRAKRRLRDAGITLDVPAASELPERLDAVLSAIYAAYSTGWDACDGAETDTGGFTEEAIWLARMLVEMMPDEAEALGLLALMLHCEARQDARRSTSGRYLPLAEQDTRRWSRGLIEEAERHLSAARARGVIGRYQLEAAIQSAHVLGRLRGTTEWETIALLYEGLVAYAPTVGVYVSRAAAIAEARGPEAGLTHLTALPTAHTEAYQPYFAVLGHLCERLGRTHDARTAYERAAALTSDAAVRTYLLEKRAHLP